MVNQHPFENSHYKLLRNIVNQISDIDHWMPESVSIGIPYIMTGDFDSTNLIKYDTAKKISNDDYLRQHRTNDLLRAKRKSDRE